MTKVRTKSVARWGVYFVFIMPLIACSSSGGSLFPQIASPPPFDYANGEVLRNRMHQLAYSLQQLDLALMQQDDNPQSSQRSVVSSLRDIERIAEVLEQGDLSTTHRFLRNDMQGFISDIRRALRDAERNPPYLYTAGRVSGGCINCHRSVQ